MYNIDVPEREFEICEKIDDDWENLFQQSRRVSYYNLCFVYDRFKKYKINYFKIILNNYVEFDGEILLRFLADPNDIFMLKH